MNPEPGAPAALAPPCAASFALRRSAELPDYHQLSLTDAQGHAAHWVLPLPLKQLARRPVLLWQLPNPAEALPCLESGTLQLAPARLGEPTNLRTELNHGVLRLHFEGQLLRGYYRLHCLPTGGGQLWQLTTIGQA